jgi:hypothetical protein
MCQDFSCLITQSCQVAWKSGVTSHDHLETLFKAEMPELNDRRYLKAEITPDKGYLYPEGYWTFKIDDDTPSWFTGEHKLAAMRAHRKWKKEVYTLINLDEARNPVNPLQRIHKPTPRDIELLKEWASVGASVRDSVWVSVWVSVWDSVGASVRDSVWVNVRDSVRDSVGASVWDSVRDSVRDSVGASVGDSVWVSVGASVGASVRDSVWVSVRDSVGASVWDSVWDSVWVSVRDSVGNSVGASVRASVWVSVRDSVGVYIGSLFNIWNGGYKFQPAVDLWKRGFVASFDGKTWRLHSGKKAKIVYEWMKG